MKRIGWIGTGLMGNPMAMHLLNAGYSLYVFNRTKSKADDLILNGANWCNSPSDVVSKSEIIVSIIGHPNDVEEVYFGTKGIIPSLTNGQIVVDMTTTKPSLAKRIYNEAKQKAVSALDAPVSGGEVGAKNGTLSIMVGGDKETFEKVLPIFQVIGKNIVYQGSMGAGQHSKMCNQITIAGTMVGVCESLYYAFKAGLDLETVLKSIAKGAAACWTLDVLAPKVANNDFEPGFMVEHFVKDLGIALEEAEYLNINLPGLQLAQELYNKVVSIGYEKKGTQVLYKVFETI